MPKHIPRIFVENLDSDLFSLTESQFHHLLSVLRLKRGDELLAFNINAGEWYCKVLEIQKKTMICEKLSQVRLFAPQPKLCLAFCPIKNENLKLIIEKGTELGVSDFFPISSRYTNAKINLEKLKAIAISAAEQSERLDIPNIFDIVSISQFLNALPVNIEWFSCIERNSGQEINLKNKPCGFIIGPEGGFSKDEKQLLISKTIPVSLSKNILRSETAAIACLSAYNFQNCFD